MNMDGLTRLRRGLRQHFGPGAVVFVDPVLWMTGLVAVDLLRLDDWLHCQHPDYTDESTREFIRRKYGSKAERFVESWIRGESIRHRESG
jgi:hypothetical protein